MKLLKYIFGISTDQEIKQETSKWLDDQLQESADSPSPSQPTNQEGMVAVTFLVSEAGSVSINVDWNKDDSSMAEILGTLLHYISAGKVAPELEAVVHNHMKKNPKDVRFLKETLYYWQNHFRADTETVKPSEVFRLGQDYSRPNHYGKTEEK